VENGDIHEWKMEIYTSGKWRYTRVENGDIHEWKMEIYTSEKWRYTRVENGDIHEWKMEIYTSGNQILRPLLRVEVWKMETGNRNYSEK